MPERPVSRQGRPDERLVRETLQAGLEARLGAPAAIAELAMVDCEYSTSFPIREVDVLLQDGSRHAVVFKDLSEGSLLETARSVRANAALNPLREIEVYRSILNGRHLDTAEFIGARADPNAGRYWLFLERVPGVQLVEVGDFEIWLEVARYLARLHSTLSQAVSRSGETAPLLRYDRQFLEYWPRRALSFAAGEAGPAASALERVCNGYRPAIDRLLALPVTIVHGDFNASNIIVSTSGSGTRIAPVDWELAGIGPGLVDLAALVSGAWSEAEQDMLAAAYREALQQTSRRDIDPVKFREDLMYCQLHLALQWLGWSESWCPPPEHRCDWREQAVSLSRRLKLTPRSSTPGQKYGV